MLASLSEPRTYISIGLVVGIIVFVLSYFLGPQIAGVLIDIERAGSAVIGVLAQAVTQPLIFIALNPIPGAIAAALLWPLLLLLLLLLFLVTLIGLGAGAAGDVRRELN